ncbi:MAG TPA: serine hydrolase domain-containing protein [Bryobacteraceae bacterium]|nr:serine hydrolase domain-containing protein [Bryobacteraceae bacterium]
MKPRACLILFFISLLVCSPMSSRPQNPAPTASMQTVTADTPRTTPGGVAFTVPAGWSVASDSSSVSMQSPEADTHVVIFDMQAADAAAAVAQAWAKYRPGFSRPLKAAVPVPDREGWKDGKQFIYETSPNERAVVVAVALHAGNAWTVVLLDGSESTFGKRGAQVATIAGSLKPKAYQAESFAGRKALPLTPERIQELRGFVEASMKKLGVPGVGLALIDHGEVVYEGGIGVKELGKPDPVDANTLFMAASNTKGMTTLMLAKLVDAKKLQWNQPVTQVYPAFKLGDENTTREVEIKHLICACTGLPRQDLEWLFEYKKLNPASTFTLLSGMQPTSKFGEVFQYSNLMASAAGYIGAHIYEPSAELGAAYDHAMEKQIFGPLGMKNTTFDMAKAQHGNFASPHSDDVDGHMVVIKMDQNYSVVPFRPAGGVWTSAHDMTRYALLELSRGKLPDGQQFVSEENLLMRRKPQISTGEDQSYGMGLWNNNHWGIPIVHHGGSMFGYKSDWMILPDSGIGAVLLTNSDNGGMLLGPFMRRLVEVVFDGKPEAVASVDTDAANYRTLLAKERARLVVPASAEEVAKLANHYSNAALGNIFVKRSGAKTVFAWDGGESEMATRKNDDGTISFITVDPPLTGLELVKAEREGKRCLILRDAQHEYVFTETT